MKIRSRASSFLRASLALLALGLVFPLVSAQEGPEARSALELVHRDEVRTRYAQARWTRGEPRTGLATDLALPGWVAGQPQSERGLLTRTFRRADEPEGAPAFVLETRVADSLAEAQELLVIWLAGVQSGEAMPSAAEVGLTLGDAAFVGRSGAGPAALAWIAFVRGNVAVRVLACDAPRTPDLDLGALAGLVDQAILRAPRLAAGSVPARPEVRFRNAPRAVLVAGGTLRLDISVTDPAGGAPHLEWVVGGPGQGYVERAADGAWELHTTGPGALTLALEVTGSTGTWSRQTLDLSVLDD